MLKLACLALATAVVSGKTIVQDYTIGNPSTLVKMSIDDTLLVILSENPSTGYQWIVNDKQVNPCERVQFRSFIKSQLYPYSECEDELLYLQKNPQYLEIASQEHKEPNESTDENGEPLFGMSGTKEILLIPRNISKPGNKIIQTKSEVKRQKLELIYCRLWELKRIMNKDGTINSARAAKYDISVEVVTLEVEISGYQS